MRAMACLRKVLALLQRGKRDGTGCYHARVVMGSMPRERMRALSASCTGCANRRAPRQYDVKQQGTCCLLMNLVAEAWRRPLYSGAKKQGEHSFFPSVK